MGKIYSLSKHKSPVSLLHCFFILSFHTEHYCSPQFFIPTPIFSLTSFYCISYHRATLFMELKVFSKFIKHQ